MNKNKIKNWFRKNKAMWVGGIICFIIPWLLFIIIWLDCVINKQTDCGFGVGIIFGLVIFFSLAGLILGIIIGVLIKTILNKKR